MRFAFLLAALTAAAPASAQDAAPDPRCTAARFALPAPLAGWGTRAPLNAGVGTRSAPVLPVGRGADLRLSPAPRVTLATVPDKAGERGQTAGLALFQIMRPGTYRIALGTPAWIEVVRAGRTLPAAAQGHGPACSGIRKTVDYHLTPGRYVLQMTRTQAPVVPVMIAPAVAA